MTFRLVVLFALTLAVASTASAACLTCVPRNLSGDGSCQPSDNGRCTYTCCLSDPGQYCVMGEHQFNCSEEIPSAYFTTRAPIETEGSSLRLRLGKGKPVAKKCGPVIPRVS